MRYFYLFYTFFIIWVIGFHCCGHSSLKYLKDNLNYFLYSSREIENKSLMNLLWSCKIGCGTCGYYACLSPLFEKFYIFAVDYYGLVKKINFDTGECVWTKNLSIVFSNSIMTWRRSASLSSGVVISNNYLYFGSELGKVYSLDEKTGAILWIADVFGEVISKPVISCGLVLVYTSNGILYALDEMNGIIKWIMHFEIPSFNFRVVVLPSIVSKMIVIGDASGSVSACDINTGQLLWQTKITNFKGFTDIDKLSDVISLIVMDNIVYAASCNGNMVALDVFSGSIIWSKDVGALVSIVADDNFLYIVDQCSRVVMLNKSNGTMVWTRSNFMYRQLTSITLYKKYILLSDSRGYLYFLHKKDGFLFERKQVCVGWFDQPIVIFDKVIIYEKNGKLSIWSLITYD